MDGVGWGGERGLRIFSWMPRSNRCLAYHIATIAFLCRLLPSSTSPTLIVFFIPYYHNLQSSPPSEETPPQARALSDDAVRLGSSAFAKKQVSVPNHSKDLRKMTWIFSLFNGPSGFSANSKAEDVTNGIDGTGLTAIVTDAHKRYGCMGTLLVIKVYAESASEFGELVADSVTKELLHYTEKPETFVSDLTNCGVYVFTPEIFNVIQDIHRHHEDRG
ncbi:hypothetical protein L1887_36311 [Cichorium endivia]|nr:hypothetical protein L1887_36311 [Cichorium endivia]